MIRLYHLLTWHKISTVVLDHGKTRYLLEKVVTIWPFVHIVKDGHLWPNDLPSSANRCLEFYLDHVASLETTALGHAVYQRFVEINDQRLLVRPESGRSRRGVGRLAPRY
jgi:hypothetical protein